MVWGMRLRIFLWLSLGLNLALAQWLGFLWFQKTEEIRLVEMTRRPAKPAPLNVKTNVVLRRQFFTWQEVESSDYPTYMANLRSIGCPEQTIRDIIVADVNQLYAKRKAAELVSADQQWWRSEPDLDATEAGLGRLEVLEAERIALLDQLLGEGWRGVAKPLESPPNTPLDGPVLGLLAPEVRQAVVDIAARTEQRIAEYAEAQRQAGRPINRAEVAKLRQQMRNELAQVLTPAQMEEYLLRYSSTAERLRDALAGVAVSPEEFRRLFQARDQVQMQLELLSGSEDAASRRRVAELEAKMEADLRQQLGEERYDEHRRATDPHYGAASEWVAESGLRKELVQPLSEFLRTAEAERQRILADPGLNAEQQASAMAQMETEYLESLRKLLGDEAFARYLEGRSR